MKKIYLFFTVVGFIAPNILVAIESFETGNFMLYTNPMATINGMFANRISTIFGIDLLMAVLVFIIWSYGESKRLAIKKVGIVWIVTFLFGLAGAFPLFLYLREGKLSTNY